MSLEAQPTPRGPKTHPIYNEISNPHGIEYFMMEKDRKPEELVNCINTFLTPAEQALFAPHAAFAINFHGDQKRRDGFTPYANHPLRSTIRLLSLRSKGLNVPFSHVLAMTGHDTREDRPEDMTAAEFEKKYFDTVGRTPLNEEAYEIIKIFDNKDDERREIPTETYYENLKKAGLGYLKVTENRDSFRGDHAWMRDDGLTLEILITMAKALKKLTVVDKYFKDTLPFYVTNLLHADITFGYNTLNVPLPDEYKRGVYPG